MGRTEGHAGRIVEVVLLSFVSLACAGALATLAQTPFLAFFCWAVPGEKSNDGPILIVLAYLLLILVVPIVLALGIRRLGRAKTVALAVASGPTLMLIASAASAWMARFPASGR